MFFFFSSRRRHTRCALVTGVQTCALPIFVGGQPLHLIGLSAQQGGDGVAEAGQICPQTREIVLHVVGGGRIRGLAHGFSGIGTRGSGGIGHRTLLKGGLWSRHRRTARSEEHTSELQSLMRNSYDVFCLKKKKKAAKQTTTHMITNI